MSSASLVFDLPALPSVTIAGSDRRFPVGRIFCVGRNYAAHAREMGSDPDREPPFFFGKFPQALVPGGGAIPYPPMTANYHYEAELVIAIGKPGFAVDVAHALDLVYGYAVGLDMTRRDLQFESRDKGRPWETGKSFAYSAPISTLRPVEGHGHARQGPDPAHRQRRGPPARRPHGSHLEQRRDHRSPERVRAAAPRRSHLHRHARRRRSGGAEGRHRGHHRGIAVAHRHHRRARVGQDVSEIVLHDFALSSASYRVRIALNLKGLAYESRSYKLRAKEQCTPEYLALNPAGLVPTLEIDGRRLTQSLAIIDYLDATHPEPHLVPRDAAERARVLAFALTFACDVHPLNNLRVLLYLEKELGLDEPARERWIAEWTAPGLATVETMLRERPETTYAAGEVPGLADICIVPQIFHARRYKVDLAPYPRLIAVADRALADPAFAKAAPRHAAEVMPR